MSTAGLNFWWLSCALNDPEHASRIYTHDVQGHAVMHMQNCTWTVNQSSTILRKQEDGPYGLQGFDVQCETSAECNKPDKVETMRQWRSAQWAGVACAYQLSNLQYYLFYAELSAHMPRYQASKFHKALFKSALDYGVCNKMMRFTGSSLSADALSKIRLPLTAVV